MPQKYYTGCTKRLPLFADCEDIPSIRLHITSRIHLLTLHILLKYNKYYTRAETR
jgi:hypothetical protein